MSQVCVWLRRDDGSFEYYVPARAPSPEEVDRRYRQSVSDLLKTERHLPTSLEYELFRRFAEEPILVREVRLRVLRQSRPFGDYSLDSEERL